MKTFKIIPRYYLQFNRDKIKCYLIRIGEQKKSDLTLINNRNCFHSKLKCQGVCLCEHDAS